MANDGVRHGWQWITNGRKCALEAVGAARVHHRHQVVQIPRHLRRHRTHVPEAPAAVAPSASVQGTGGLSHGPCFLLLRHLCFLRVKPPCTSDAAFLLRHQTHDLAIRVVTEARAHISLVLLNTEICT